MKIPSKKLVLTAFFIALGFILPFFTGQIPSIGNKLLPMHLPIILCGFICGPQYGVIAGFVTPLFRSMIWGMPPMFPVATAMAFELATYGLIAGILYRGLPKNKFSIFLSLITAMIAGRIVWGIVSYFLFGINNIPFNFDFFIGAVFINAIPGIILQLFLVPLIIGALERTSVLEND